jgi:hemerythrin
MENIMPITWTSQYLTGVAHVDDQHKTIINQFNVLHDQMKQGKGKGEIGKTLDFLETYTIQHFSDEEKIMKDNKCEMAAENIQQHAVFIRKIADFKKRFESNPTDPTLVLNVHNDLSDWFVNHILKIDLKLQDCVK